MIQNQKVVLLGPMGAGKTTIGNLLALRFNWEYFDNDFEMTPRFGYSQEELSSMPVIALHEIESRYLSDVLAQEAPFITGAAASVVDYPENRALLEANTAIYLRIPLEQVISRAGKTGVGRQALAQDAEKVLTERYLRRDPLYRAVAALTVDLTDQPQRDAEMISHFLQSKS
jgi:shikimate kinase